MSTPNQLPEQFEPLDVSKHQDLKRIKSSGFAFAKNLASVPLAFSEMQAAARFFPIVLPQQGMLSPMALFSLKEDSPNPYVDEKGNWKVPYIPICLRLYPFILARVEDKETKKDKFVLCIDRDSDHLSKDEGEPLFTEKGELSDLTQKTFEMLKVYQQELSTTQAIFTQLAEKELVVDQEGFKAVDLEKITTLDDAAIAGFVKNGTMPLIYCHLQSLTHLHQTAS